MPATMPVRPRERFLALAGVLAVQLALGVALILGLNVDVLRRSEVVSQLIDVSLKAPPPQAKPAHQVKRATSAAPKSVQDPTGGSPGPQRSRAVSVPLPIVAVHAAAPMSGSGVGSGPAIGSGTGGGSGGQGDAADDDGGTDLVQIAGEIRPSDYPRDLRERGIGGRVGVVFTVGTDGRVSNCTVTRSSGVPELDSLTCRLIRERFRYRPSTDRYGRAISDEVEGEHDWIGGR
jgi:protein TonB